MQTLAQRGQPHAQPHAQSLSLCRDRPAQVAVASTGKLSLDICATLIDAQASGNLQSLLNETLSSVYHDEEDVLAQQAKELGLDLELLTQIVVGPISSVKESCQASRGGNAGKAAAGVPPCQTRTLLRCDDVADCEVSAPGADGMEGRRTIRRM